MQISRVVTRQSRGFVGAGLLVLAVSVTIAAQSDDGFDPEVVALTYHKVSRDQLDTRAGARECVDAEQKRRTKQ